MWNREAIVILWGCDIFTRRPNSPSCAKFLRASGDFGVSAAASWLKLDLLGCPIRAGGIASFRNVLK